MAKTTETAPDVVLALAALRAARDVDVTAQLGVLVEAAAVAVAAQGALVRLGEERAALEAQNDRLRSEVANAGVNLATAAEAQAAAAARSMERVREMENAVTLAQEALLSVQAETGAERALLTALQSERQRLVARYAAAV